EEKRLIVKHRDHGITNISQGTVTAEQASVARASALLKSTKPYEEWVADLPDETCGQVCRVFGSTEKFYRWYVGQLGKLSEHPQVRELRFPAQS
ncbi:hypothetical protein LZ189_25640, partial [Rhodovulum sulfidophilum]|nr:hypothetical protein [Rhodovulum sulfidophilum]